MNQDALTAVLETIAKLRSENGSAWHRSQNHQSLRRFLLEECHEVLEILDKNPESEKNYELLKDELSDLLLQILLHSEIAKERNYFSFKDVLNHLNEKIKRRHNRSFENDSTVNNSIEADLLHWKKNKAAESSNGSILDSIPDNLPALSKAQKVIDRVSNIGFQWNDLLGPIQKLEEEILELKKELEPFKLLPVPFTGITISVEQKKRIESEIGDCLFCLTNISHLVDLNAEDSLRSMLLRFGSRFRFIEQAASSDNVSLEDLSLEEMDRYWNRAKEQEKRK